MCLIAVSPKGTQKYSEFFLNGIKRAAVTNTDGIGYSFKRAGSNKVWIAKGFKNVDNFIKALKAKRLKDEDELVVHLRIGNKGSKTTEMNHPFVVSNKPDTILTNDSYVTETTMCHNGTFHDYSVYQSNFSDTYFFIKDFISVPEVQQLLKRDLDLFKAAFKHILKTNRLAFIFNDDTPLAIIGEFKEEEGYFFSNESYKKDRYVNIGGQGFYPRHEDEFDWNDWEGDRAAAVNRVTRQTSLIPAIPVRSSSGRTMMPDRSITKTDTTSTDTTTGEGAGNRWRMADPSTEIVPDYRAASILDIGLKRQYYSAFEDSLYIPGRFFRSQWQNVKFVPKSWNCSHFRYSPYNVSSCDMEYGLTYQITEFDMSTDLSIGKAVHTLQPIGGGKFDLVYMTTQELLENCVSNVSGKWLNTYFNVYRLIQAHEIPSKSLYNQLEKVIRNVRAKRQNKDVVTFKALNNLNLTSLEIYQNYIAESVYSDDKLKFLNVIRESSILVN